MFAEHLTSINSSPERQIGAVIASRDFLLRLTKPKETPRVPPSIRREALALLRHFPPGDRLRPVLEACVTESAPPEPGPLVEKFGLFGGQARA